MTFSRYHCRRELFITCTLSSQTVFDQFLWFEQASAMVIPYHDFPVLKIHKCQYDDSCIPWHSCCETDIGVHFQTFFEAVDGSDLNQIKLNEFGVVTQLEKSFRPLNVGKGVQRPSCNLKIKARVQETVLLSFWTTINIAIMIIIKMMMMMIIHGANTFTSPF